MNVGGILKKLFAVSAIAYTIMLILFCAYMIVNKKDAYYNYKNNITYARKNYTSSSIKDASKSEDTKKAESKASKDNDKEASKSAQTTTQPASQPKTKDEDYKNVAINLVLNEGATGDQVKKLQYVLNTKGYYKGEINGNFSPETTDALKKFQHDNKITADGICGPSTIKALNK